MLQVVNLDGSAGLKGEKGDRVSVKDICRRTNTCMCVVGNVSGMYEVITCAQTSLARSAHTHFDAAAVV